VFMLLVAVSQPTAFVLVIVWMVLSYVVYRVRLQTFAGDDEDLKKRMKGLDAHE